MLGSKLGKNMKAVAAVIQNFTSEEIASILDGNAKTVSYDGGSIDITEGDLAVQRSEKEHVKVLNDGALTVGYDTEITRELFLEGIARDLVRFVQTERKEKNFEVADHINLSVSGNADFLEAVGAFRSYIMQETLADTLTTDCTAGAETEIADEPVKVSVEKA